MKTPNTSSAQTPNTSSVQTPNTSSLQAPNTSSVQNATGGPTSGSIDPVITKKIPYIRRLTIYADPPAVTAGKKLIDLTLATTKFVDINVDANGVVKTNTYVGKTMKVHFKDIPGYETPADYSLTVPECVEYYVRGTYKAQKA